MVQFNLNNDQLCVRVLEQLWPSVGHYITHYISTEVEPWAQDSLQGYNFKFDHVLLGSLPPRIGGMKCYDKHFTSRHEIILDLEVCKVLRYTMMLMLILILMLLLMLILILILMLMFYVSVDLGQ